MFGTIETRMAGFAILASTMSLGVAPAFASERLAAMIEALDARISELEAKGKKLEWEAAEAKAREKAALAKLAVHQSEKRAAYKPDVKLEPARSVPGEAMAYVPRTETPTVRR